MEIISLIFNEDLISGAMYRKTDMLVDEKPHDENMYYVCTLCETPTKFTEYADLEKHDRRFHSYFNQNEQGSKK